MMSDICVVGGSGFVGSYFTRALARLGRPSVVVDLMAPVSSEQRWFYSDVRNLAASQLSGFQVETIVNLAAEHRDDVTPLTRYYDVNVEGAHRVCEVAEKLDVNNIIFTSSVAVYGFAPPDTDETGEINFFNEYGKTKHLAEQVYLDWQSRDPHNRSLVIVRPTVIFGPGNRGNVFNLLKQIASRRFAMFGSGQNVKSMAYVENVADFLVHALGCGPGVNIYNYVDKPDLTVNEIVATTRTELFGINNVGVRLPAWLGVCAGAGFDVLASITRRKLPVSSIRIKKFMATTQFASSSQASGFRPRYSMLDGLKKTLRYEFVENNSDKRVFKTE